MTDERKNKFIEEVERLFNENEVDEVAIDFFNDYKKGHTSNRKEITDKGIKIIKAMSEMSEDLTGIFTAKDIGDYLDTSGKSVSGSMRKLVDDGYIIKHAGNPAAYSLGEKGIEYVNSFEAVEA